MEENIAHDDDLISSTQILRLPEGIYSFTIQGTPAAETRGDLVLPALQVGLAPAKVWWYKT